MRFAFPNEEMSFEPGQVIDGKYRLVRVIGEGGMGVVFEAENFRIKRRVAIKVLRPEVAQTPEHVVRFEREAQAAARIGSRHIVDVLDLGETEHGDRYLVMEFLEGESLAQRIARVGPLAPRNAVEITMEILTGLANAHDAGIIHRDLKLENIFLTRTSHGELVKLLDFGVSKFNDGTGMSMTRTGAVLGTPAYMAPEQVRGFLHEIDHRVDIYAVGVMLFEAITAQLPYLAESLHDLLFRIGTERARSLRSVVATVDPDLDGIVARALVREPSARFSRASDFRAALASWLAAQPISEAFPATVRAPALQGTVKIHADLRATTPAPASFPDARSAGLGATLPLATITRAPLDPSHPAIAMTPAAWGSAPVSWPGAVPPSTPLPTSTPAPKPATSSRPVWFLVAGASALIALLGIVSLVALYARKPKSRVVAAEPEPLAIVAPIPPSASAATPAPLAPSPSVVSSAMPALSATAAPSAAPPAPDGNGAPPTPNASDPRRYDSVNGRRIRSTL